MSNKLDRIAAALFIIAGLLAARSVGENLLSNQPFEWGPLALAALCAFAAIARAGPRRTDRLFRVPLSSRDFHQLSAEAAGSAGGADGLSSM